MCIDDEDDIAWISSESGMDLDEIRTLIEEERGASFTAEYPLSSNFIAELLGLQRDTVSQRVRRARVKLAALLGGER
jgi:DNA-directed RNA polymerase specialized sigma24 family protein